MLPSVNASRIEARSATMDEVLRIHAGGMLKSLAEACGRGDTIIDPAPTYVTSQSLTSALRAAGGAIDCVRQVWRGDATAGFAIVRPPGHHAEPHRSMGFCLLNNIAIAAADSLAQGAQRVAIVDFDAHHGNGTQAAFEAEARVAFLSMHQWGIYPGTGWYEEAPHARARIVNVPLPAMSGDKTYEHVGDSVLTPWIDGFRPELILVSAGFDAHWNDPITTLGLTESGFHALSRRLVQLAGEYCQGRIVFVLEGGYEALNVARGAMGVFAALTDSAFEAQADICPYMDPEPLELIQRIRNLHGLGM